jgi:hypothetical protein
MVGADHDWQDTNKERSLAVLGARISLRTLQPGDTRQPYRAKASSTAEETRVSCRVPRRLQHEWRLPAAQSELHSHVGTLLQMDTLDKSHLSGEQRHDDRGSARTLAEEADTLHKCAIGNPRSGED